MAFQIKHGRAGTGISLKERLKDKPAMLSFSMLWGSRWLMLRGIVILLPATLFVNLPHTRNHPLALLPQAELGAALLALGYFISRAVDDPRRQYLAVDALSLYLITEIIAFFLSIARVPEILVIEWIGLAGNVIFCGLLLFYRSRESELRGNPGAPREAREAAKDLIRSLKMLIEKDKKPVETPEPPGPKDPSAP